MNRWRLGLGMLSVVAVATLGPALWQRVDREAPASPLRGFDQPDAALDYYVSQRAPLGSQEIPVERYAQALAQRADMPQVALHASAEKLGARLWRQSGPDQVGGRTRDLVFDPVDPQIMYAAAVSGGVWKSTDGAQSWALAGEQLNNLAVVALAFETGSGRLFAGTGEGVYVNRPVSRSRGVRGDGIFVSADGGAHWLQLAATVGNADFDYVNDLQFDDDGRLYAATRTGVHVSVDGGVSFIHSLLPAVVEGCTAVAVASAAGTVLASCGAHSPGGIWLSADHGVSWSKSYGDSLTGRSSLAVAPSDRRVVYALVADPTDYAMRRVLRSDDGGRNWQTRVQRGAPGLGANLLLSNGLGSTNEACTAIEFVGGQGWFDNALAVDPVNPDVVWAGGVDLLRSDDGARSFGFASAWYLQPGDASYVHADQHVIAFHPDYDGNMQQRLFVANDGGIHSTDMPMAAVGASPCSTAGIGVQWQLRNRGYFATQFYHGDASADGAWLAGGAQDNGTLLGPPQQPQAWRSVFGGDGVYTLFDPRDANRAYFGSQFAYLQRTDDGFETITPIDPGLSFRDVLFITPLTLDPQNPDTLYSGGRVVVRSRDRGDSWSAISTRGLDPADGIVSAVSVAPDNSERVAAGFDSGALIVTDNAQATTPVWRVSQPRAGFVSGITQAAGGGPIYATYSTFGGSKVYRSSDGGANWQAIDRAGERGGLPDVPAHDLLIDPLDPTRLLLGTDIGLFIGLDGGARWAADASGLGNVLIEKLVSVAHQGGHSLHAFTYGRGVLSTDLADLPRLKTNPGWSGLWFDPAQDGQGMQIEIVPETESLVVGWYTHVPAGGSQTRNNQLWMIGSAPLHDGVAELTMYRSRGRFDADGNTLEIVGNLRLSFHSCDSASARFELNLDGAAQSGSIDLQRVTPDAICERFRALGDGALSTLPPPIHAADFQYGSTGSWYNPDTDGQGMLIEYLPATQTLAVSWYSYDYTDPAPDGSQAPLWLTAVGPVSGDRADLLVTLTRGGAFNSGDPVTRSAVGMLTITQADCTHGRADYELSIDGISRSGSIPLQRLTPATLCRPPR